MLAMVGLIVFILLYCALIVGFGLIAFNSIETILNDQANLWDYVVAASSALLMVFMVKSLFAVSRAGDPGGVEVTENEEPVLFGFLYQLADEIKAPRPHRVFITADVNAAVTYDLSLLNLFFPSRKNLIIGLGLVNTLNLGEMKAVLAHEFGHFAQSSMMVGRWVYIAQQIITHMVATRDWLDSIVSFLSRIDLRIAWIGWLLSLILWSIRSLMDTLFGLVVMAERALSREMEFNADLVAVSVTGSDALINALHKLQAADHAWQTALDVADSEAGQGRALDDLFVAQRSTLSEMRRILNDRTYGLAPDIPSDAEPQDYRVFDQESARPPQMWSTHPENSDREDNAKKTYIHADIDKRDAWELFADPISLRQKITQAFYNPETLPSMSSVSPSEAVVSRFSHETYSTEYRGTYLGRSPMRNFRTVEEMLEAGSLKDTAALSLAEIYPESISSDLDRARNLDIERDTLEALERGDLKPSGGVIRHRGHELKKKDIPDAIREIAKERKDVADVLRSHDASCRRAHLQAATEIGAGWDEYLGNLIRIAHCAEHLGMLVRNEHALLVNTWQVITADGQVGYFEKKRMIGVCENVHALMNKISPIALQIRPPVPLLQALGIEDWEACCPVFNLVVVDGKNWAEWCEAAAESMSQVSGALDALASVAMTELINTEADLRARVKSMDPSVQDLSPETGSCPTEYPVLLPGDEHELQRKLDLWNRFQLAQGFMPSLGRLMVSVGIVGGTLYAGLVGF